MPIEEEINSFRTDDLLIDERVVTLAEGEQYRRELPNQINDSDVLLMVQPLEGELGMELDGPLKRMETQAGGNGAHIWQGEFFPGNRPKLLLFSRGLSRVRIIYVQLKKRFIRKMHALPCDFCKYAIKVIVNFVLMFHGCPVIPGGGFDASAMASGLLQLDQAIASGNFGPVIQALAAALPQSFWGTVVAVMQALNFVFCVTDAFLTKVCVKIGLCQPNANCAGP